MNQRRLAIIGAGPIGLEAALAGVQAGFDAQVYERGSVGEHVWLWGHVTLFSPFGMNSSVAGRHAIRSNGGTLPDESALLTGRDYAERYLLPLSQVPELKGRIHEQSVVIGIGRNRLTKSEAIGKLRRASDPFRLLLLDAQGQRSALADVVFDCSGVYRQHNSIGAGGLPAVGERWALGFWDYRLPDILSADREKFAGKQTLVIGSGFSAATAVVSLAELTREDPGTTAIWITRTNRTPPMERLDNDALAERDRLAAAANEIALDPQSPIQWRPGRIVESIERISNPPSILYQLELALTEQQAGDREKLRVDRVIANVGYRPDRSLYEELQVHECYATQGPMKLAAALLGETSPDCLAQRSHGVETLCNPEPGFFILGAKSYGRDSRFLVSIGLQQVREVIAFISK